MALEKVRAFLKKQHMEDRLLLLEQSSATVQEAAEAIGCEPGQIAKTMSFLQKEGPALIVMAGDGRTDNHKYKETFGQKAKMIPWDMVEELVGHAPGGVCPFAINDGIPVYLDESLKRYEKVYPAAGNDHSAVFLAISELEALSHAAGWVDICGD